MTSPASSPGTAKITDDNGNTKLLGVKRSFQIVWPSFPAHGSFASSIAFLRMAFMRDCYPLPRRERLRCAVGPVHGQGSSRSRLHASTARICRHLPDWLEAFGPTAIECGFDAGDVGDDATRALMAADPRVSRARPKGARDWNELPKLRARQYQSRTCRAPKPGPWTAVTGSQPNMQITGTGCRNHPARHTRITVPTRPTKKRD